MMKILYTKLFAIAAALLMSQGMMAQTNIVFEESFYDGLGDFTLEGYTGSESGKIWTWNESNHMAKAEINNSLANYYVNPRPKCLLQSPEIKLGNETYVATFDQANVWMPYPEDEVALIIHEVGSEVWEILTGPLMKYDNWPLSSVGVIVIPSNYKNKTVEFAFRFNPLEVDFDESGNWYVKDFVVWAGSATDKLDAKLTFDEASYEADYYDGFMSPAVNNPNEVEVKYSSSNPDVAKVDEATGEVSLVGVGTATITAQSVENEYFRTSSAGYELKVVKGTKYNDIFVETFANGFNGFTVEGYNGNKQSVWTMDESFAKAYGYGLADEPFTNYLVSPVFLLDGTSCIAKFNYTAMYFADDEVINQMAFSIREEGGQWQDLVMPVCQNSGALISSGKIAIPETYNGKKVQVAFKYSAASNNTAGCWKVTNLHVQTPDTPAGINDVEAEKVSNKIYDLQGREVKSPAQGLYIVNDKKVIIK